MGVKINLSTDRPQYVSGDAVEGAIRIDVTTNDAEGSSAERLMLRLTGRARTRVVRGAGRSRTTHLDGNTFLEIDNQLMSFGGKVAAGSHSFPFSMRLPPGVPPSMKEKNNHGGCSIEYTFEARLHRPGILNFDATDRSTLKVLSRPEVSTSARPYVAGPETRRVKRCCCFNKGSMSIGFEADQSAVGINEPVSLVVAARNDSSLSVQSMRVEIVQVCVWRARGATETKQRTIASMVVPGSQLGEVQQAAAERDLIGRSAIAVKDEARTYLKNVLAAKTGTRCELSIPDDSLVTLRLPKCLIDVRHSLNARLNTPICTNSPDICMRINVQGETIVVGSG